MSDARWFRRLPVASLLALIASIALVMMARDARANGCKPDGKVCSTNISCCSRNCAKPTPKKATALFGTCCPSGDRLCGNVCVDVSTDPSNCGTCSNVCSAGRTCTAGVCTCTPNCAFKTCGDNGCGGSCGTCDVSQCLTCSEGMSTAACVSACTSEEVCNQGVCETTTTTTTTTTATTTTTVLADLSLTKVSSPTGTIFGNTPVTFTVTLHNAGPATATGVAVTDLLPASFTFDSANASQGTYSSATGAWSVGTLASGDDATLGIMTHADTCDPTYRNTTQQNTAEVTAADQADPDSMPGNDNPSEDDQAIASVFFGCD